MSQAKLTAKQDMFCREYLVDLNATQAALRAGYSAKTATAIGNENLTKPNITDKIQILFGERADRVELNSDWVLNRLKEIDSLDVLDIVNDDLSGFKLLSEWPKEWRTSISSLDMKKMVTSVGENEELETIIEKIKWPDKVKNLEMIGRHVKIKAWDKEAQAVTVSNNIMPVPTADSIDSWEEQAQLQQDKVLGK
jgi:phage terminase small subunit